ncbi:hypothetical protein [Ensifer adhaerens]|uniref:hypothetical protein n=1 Tax=Ensifer adhaerens TaxID=106592 RepID=UPI00128F741C|nr:hypothetical protein [Ensifer adhaerens]
MSARSILCSLALLLAAGQATAALAPNYQRWSNLWSLSRYHHGRKFSLEIYARDHGLLEMLPNWCRDRDLRLVAFR